jgi:peptidoglycan/xylan/chitin deacetylase (PgdA/CDA1 family)
MSNPPEPESFNWVQWFLTHGLSFISGGFIGGLVAQEHSFGIERRKERRNAVKNEIASCHDAIQRCTGRSTKGVRSLVFRREEFADSRDYLAIRKRLPKKLRERIEFQRFVSAGEFYSGRQAKITDPSFTDAEVREELVTFLTKLERQWGF